MFFDVMVYFLGGTEIHLSSSCFLLYVLLLLQLTLFWTAFIEVLSFCLWQSSSIVMSKVRSIVVYFIIFTLSCLACFFLSSWWSTQIKVRTKRKNKEKSVVVPFDSYDDVYIKVVLQEVLLEGVFAGINEFLVYLLRFVDSGLSTLWCHNLVSHIYSLAYW